MCMYLLSPPGGMELWTPGMNKFYPDRWIIQLNSRGWSGEMTFPCLTLVSLGHDHCMLLYGKKDEEKIRWGRNKKCVSPFSFPPASPVCVYMYYFVRRIYMFFYPH
jgi:hypothetical protein